MHAVKCNVQLECQYRCKMFIYCPVCTLNTSKRIKSFRHIDQVLLFLLFTSLIKCLSDDTNPLSIYETYWHIIGTFYCQMSKLKDVNSTDRRSWSIFLTHTYLSFIPEGYKVTLNASFLLGGESPRLPLCPCDATVCFWDREENTEIINFSS